MLKAERNVLFIGHANPEDNEFTLWVRQKLINEGFQAECDMTILVGGENDYWKDIQECLEKSTCKYLLVLSMKTFQKSGILDEWEHVRSLIKKYKLKDFILPIKIDNVAYDTRIGLNRINIIDFSKSWASGLKRLVNKLEVDAVPKNHTELNLSMREWFNNRFGTGKGIIQKDEFYYSNWLEIKNLPEKFYLYQYANDTQAEFINSQLTYPNIRHDKFIITFEQEIEPFVLEKNSLFNKNSYTISYENKKEILINNISKNIISVNFPNLQDSKNFLIRLLKDAFDKHLLKMGLKYYVYSGSELRCYYYQKEFEENQIDLSYKVAFPYQQSKKKKILVGAYYDSFWHLGASVAVKLFPIYAFEIKLHILFSDDGISIWDDKARLHKARRDKGKRLFNAEWRELLFAFLYSLAKDSEEIKIPIVENQAILLSPIPTHFTSHLGYSEPQIGRAHV